MHTALTMHTPPMLALRVSPRIPVMEMKKGEPPERLASFSIDRIYQSPGLKMIG